MLTTLIDRSTAISEPKHLEDKVKTEFEISGYSRQRIKRAMRLINTNRDNAQEVYGAPLNAKVFLNYNNNFADSIEKLLQKYHVTTKGSSFRTRSIPNSPWMNRLSAQLKLTGGVDDWDRRKVRKKKQKLMVNKAGNKLQLTPVVKR